MSLLLHWDDGQKRWGWEKRGERKTEREKGVGWGGGGGGKGRAQEGRGEREKEREGQVDIARIYAIGLNNLVVDEGKAFSNVYLNCCACLSFVKNFKTVCKSFMFLIFYISSVLGGCLETDESILNVVYLCVRQVDQVEEVLQKGIEAETVMHRYSVVRYLIRTKSVCWVTYGSQSMVFFFSL